MAKMPMGEHRGSHSYATRKRIVMATKERSRCSSQSLHSMRVRIPVIGSKEANVTTARRPVTTNGKSYNKFLVKYRQSYSPVRNLASAQAAAKASRAVPAISTPTTVIPLPFPLPTHKGLGSPPRSMTPRQIRQGKHRSWGTHTQWWKLPRANNGVRTDTQTLGCFGVSLQGNMRQWALASFRDTELVINVQALKYLRALEHGSGI